MNHCIELVTVLFILLLLSIITIITLVRRMSLKEGKTMPEGSAAIDIALALATAKSKEAQLAAEQIQHIADRLGIGIASFQNLQVSQLNKTAKMYWDMLGEDTAIAAVFSAVEGEGIIIHAGDKILQFNTMKTDSEAKDTVQEKKIVTIQDVTTTYNMTSQLRQQERLAILGKMSAQMAHQLKTPLAVLAGRAQLLARSLQKDVELKNKAFEIYQEAKELSTRISDIVAFYKDGGLCAVDTNAQEILSSLLIRLKKLEHDCKIHITKRDIEMNTDPRALENALFLLAQNAVAPSVGANNLYITVLQHENDKNVVFRVQDDGKGIPASIKKSMFEPFVSTKTDGLGLGLFLAKDTAKKLGGELKLLEEETMTTFEVVIPQKNIGNSHKGSTKKSGG